MDGVTLDLIGFFGLIVIGFMAALIMFPELVGISGRSDETLPPSKPRAADEPGEETKSS